MRNNNRRKLPVSKKQLVLEILTGPLDGYHVTLKKEAKLSKKGKGPLIFPWDTELGEPQARFFREEDDWFIEGFKAKHGTYQLNQRERIETKVKLEKGDLLKASDTWLLIENI